MFSKLRILQTIANILLLGYLFSQGKLLLLLLLQQKCIVVYFMKVKYQSSCVIETKSNKLKIKKYIFSSSFNLSAKINKF